MLKTLKKLAFERVGGTDEEKKVFEIIAEEIRSIGFEPIWEPFEVDTFRAGNGSITVEGTRPHSYKVNPVGLSGSADVSGKLRFIEASALPHAKSAEGEIVLINDHIGYKAYEKLSKIKALAFLTVSSPGKPAGFPSLKKLAIERFGKIPGGVVTYETGLKLISKVGKKARLFTEQKEFVGVSHNLITFIPGEIEDEDLVLCAHADSVADSPGAIDNAAGCVELIGLISYFKKNKPRRNLRCCFFGSEELGLLGSHAYVDAHRDELSRIRLVINLDLGGDIFGDNQAFITGGEEIANYIDSRNKLRGLGLKVKKSIYSSDNMPFARQGIPSISFGRAGLGTSLGHSCKDVVSNVDERSLRSMAQIALEFVYELANASEFPFERKIPQDIADEVAKYFRERQGLD